MRGVLTQGNSGIPATAENVAAAMSGGQFFWLDLDAGEGSDDLTALLTDTFHFHPLAVEDAEHFGQRPKLDDYDDYVYMVAHGAAERGTGTVEVHLFFSDRYAVTIHRGACGPIDGVRARIAHRHASGAPQIALVYLIVDALTDSFFPVLSEFDERIDALEDAILVRPTEEQLGEVFAMKRRLMAIRKVVTPPRDMFAGLSAGVTQLPGTSDESARYFRDLYDHLIRISDMVDGYRDLLSGVMDTHISTVSNRLNVVMKQLAIIATIFLPLSYLTGFFGQNFAWLVLHIGGSAVFFGVGVGTEVVAVVILFALFKRRGWLGGPAA
ncbi:MAG: magnesium transporter CorA family protein [Acidimicrobiales bacterium]